VTACGLGANRVRCGMTQKSNSVSAPAPKANRPVEGIFWMVVTGLCFVGVTASVKVLDGGLPAAQSAFLRYLLGLVLLLPMIRPILAAQISRADWGLYCLRGAAHTIGVMLWFFAMARITIAELTALNYLTPVYVTLGAAVLLGEKLAFRRLAAIGVAMCGALLILRPGVRALEAGHYAMLGAALFLAGSYLIAKKVSGNASPAVVVGLLSLTVPIGLAPFALAVWVPPSFEQIAWLGLVAVFATSGHYTMTLAFQAAPVAVTQPVIFLQLVWAVLLGAMVFGEPVDIWVVSGGVVIIAAVSFIAWREAVVKRRRLSAATVPSKM
jgi:drug/metabolite transporter (DMT)-like permease